MITIHYRGFTSNYRLPSRYMCEITDGTSTQYWRASHAPRTFVFAPTFPVWRAARYLRKIRKVDRLVSSYASVEASCRKGI